MVETAPGRTLYKEALIQVRGADVAVTDLQSRANCLVRMIAQRLFVPVQANLENYGLDEDTAAKAVVDSAMSYEEAVLDGLRDDCPEEVLMKQALVEVYYLGFDGQLHKGQIVVDRDLVPEVEEVFAAAFKAKFPIRSVVPVSRYAWDDDVSMNADNTSAFNYRTIFGTDVMSRHAGGRAIDINPLINPHYRGDGTIAPEGALYQAGKPGVLVEGDAVVSTFKMNGWEWGGNWDPKGLGLDYQHFEKP